MFSPSDTPAQRKSKLALADWFDSLNGKAHGVQIEELHKRVLELASELDGVHHTSQDKECMSLTHAHH